MKPTNHKCLFCKGNLTKTETKDFIVWRCNNEKCKKDLSEMLDKDYKIKIEEK